MFTDSFDDLGLDQLVNESTHLKGKTLDLLLTTSKDSISDVKVSLNEGLCKSDHFLLNFEVKTNVTYRKITKKKIYELKKANWHSLNIDLSNIEWHRLLDSV